jgi:hypothetical protein
MQDFQLPRNVRATTDAAEAITGASYAVHAVPVQHSRAFLSSIKDVLPKDVPIICVSKGLEVGTGCMMSEVIPSALGRRQPAVFLSGPSFAKEVRAPRAWGGGGGAGPGLFVCCPCMQQDAHNGVSCVGAVQWCQGGTVVWSCWCQVVAVKLQGRCCWCEQWGCRLALSV